MDVLQNQLPRCSGAAVSWLSYWRRHFVVSAKALFLFRSYLLLSIANGCESEGETGPKELCPTMSGIELLNYLQGLSEEVLDKFIIVAHPNGGRFTLDACGWRIVTGEPIYR